MGCFVFYFGFCTFHSYFELYEGLFYYILLHDLHSPCSVFLQVEISFPLMVEAWLRFLKEMFQCYFADISQVVICLPSLPVMEGSDITFLCLMPCAALNMWCRTAYFVLQNQLFRPSVSVVLLGVIHYSALFGLFLLDTVQLELFYWCFCPCVLFMWKQLYLPKTKQTKPTLIWIFFL